MPEQDEEEIPWVRHKIMAGTRGETDTDRKEGTGVLKKLDGTTGHETMDGEEERGGMSAAIIEIGTGVMAGQIGTDQGIGTEMGEGKSLASEAGVHAVEMIATGTETGTGEKTETETARGETTGEGTTETMIAVDDQHV